MTEPNRLPLSWSVCHDKIMGTVIGSAVGDCIGRYTAFLTAYEAWQQYSNENFSLEAPRTKFKSSHRDKKGPGSWSDATDQVVLLLVSLSFCEYRLDAIDFAKRIRTWVRQDNRNFARVNQTTGQPLDEVVIDSSYAQNPVKSFVNVWLKSIQRGVADGILPADNRRSADNGSVMRTYPVGIMCVQESLYGTFKEAAEFSRITHPDPRCVVSCIIVTALIRGILLGEIDNNVDVDNIIKAAFNWLIADDQSLYANPGIGIADLESQPLTADEVRELTQWDELWRYTEDKGGSDSTGSNNSPAETVESDIEELIITKPDGDEGESEDESDSDDESESEDKSGSEVESKPPVSMFHHLDLDDPDGLCYVYKTLGAGVAALRAAMREPLHSIDAFRRIMTTLIMQGGDANANAAVAGALIGAWLGYAEIPENWRKGMEWSEFLEDKARDLAKDLIGEKPESEDGS